MAQAGAVADPVQKVEDFIAAMTAVCERLASREDARAAESAAAAAAETVGELAGYLRYDSSTGLIGRFERRDIEAARRNRQLVELHLTADQERLPEGVRHLKDDVVAAITDAMREAAREMSDRAETIEQGAQDLAEALAEHRRSLQDHLHELEGAFAALGGEAMACAAVSEAVGEALVALAVEVVASDEASMATLLAVLADLLEAESRATVNLCERVRVLETETERHELEMAVATAKVAAAVVLAIVSIVVAVATFGAGGPMLMALVAAVATTVASAEAILEAVDRLLQVVVPGLDLSHAVAPFLPELEPVTALVGTVGKVLDAMNPFH